MRANTASVVLDGKSTKGHSCCMNMQKTQVNEIIGTVVAAEILGVSPDTVRRWARTGKVRYVELPSGRMRFRREDIEVLLEPVEPRGACGGAVRGLW